MKQFIRMDVLGLPNVLANYRNDAGFLWPSVRKTFIRMNDFKKRPRRPRRGIACEGGRGPSGNPAVQLVQLPSPVLQCSFERATSPALAIFDEDTVSARVLHDELDLKRIELAEHRVGARQLFRRQHNRPVRSVHAAELRRIADDE